MHLRSILALSITSVTIWSESKNVAAECDFKSNDCKVTCNYEPLEFVIESLENIWDENRETCKQSGMNLDLNYINFPNNTIYKGWFKPDINLINLDLTLTNVGTIEMDAFDSTPFFTVEEMFIKISLKSLPNGIFNGFKSLTILMLEFAVLPEVIGSNIFNVPSKTLETLYMYGGDPDFVNPKYNILRLENLTGSGILSTLEDLAINIPLNDSITRKSFVGFTNIVSIDLSSCAITTLGKGSFDSIGPNLTSLKLTNNKITTLPNDLFQRILVNDNLKIDLTKNSWNCDCHLINFQKYLTNNHQKFVDANQLTCKLPKEKETVPVMYTMIVLDEECVVTKECYLDFENQNASGTVSVSISKASISLTETNTGDLVISSLSNDERPYIPTIIWYKGQESISDEEEINCIQGLNATISSTFLMENIPYTFCYIEDGEGSTTPFDCISYIKVGVHPQIWYSENSKVYVIVVIVASLVLSLFIGIISGMKLLTILQRMINNVQNNETTITKISNATETSTNQPPPLPKRPWSLEEIDPVYTYVG